jgi:CheY-like chemotaxis protein
VSGPRVLIVDDEPQTLRALRATLHGAGYTVDVVATAEGAGRGMPAMMTRQLEAPAKIKDYARDRADARRRYDTVVLGSYLSHLETS